MGIIDGIVGILFGSGGDDDNMPADDPRAMIRERQERLDQARRDEAEGVDRTETIHELERAIALYRSEIN